MSITPVNDPVDNLKELWALLDGIPDERFDLESWRSVPDISDNDLITGCGTAACAIGWATANPLFKARGFYVGRYSPSYNEYNGWRAVEEFFGLTGEAALWLFHKNSYTEPTKTSVMNRILEHLCEFGHITKARKDLLWKPILEDVFECSTCD